MRLLGQVAALSGTFDGNRAQDIPSDFLVDMETSESFTSTENNIQGHLHTDHGSMMQGLLDDESLKLFVACTPSKVEHNTKSGPRRMLSVPCTLDIVIYGPSDMYDEIGTWFEDYNIYLQDPRKCYLDAFYFNPHRLSSVDTSCLPLVSAIVNKPTIPLQFSKINQHPDLLSNLGGTSSLEETPQPDGVRTDLRSHQKQALTFMLRREDGWGFDQSPRRSDIWDIVYDNQTHYPSYVNIISKAYQSEEPIEFAGGIVADPMGLGKTLTMIALVATDLEKDHDSQNWSGLNTDAGASVPATLIIVPPPLLGTWEHELNTHLVHGAIHHRKHHDKTRIRDRQELEGVHVVLTTYHTVSAEWNTDETRREAKLNSSILFSVKWKRIILDEAHFIRNAKSKMAKAICTLDAKARWAVTGTPIQNRLSDFAALLRFIRVYPYGEQQNFDADIANLWKTGEEEKAVDRLKRLSQYLLLRRPKDTIELPARHDMQCPVDFTRDERTVYEKMRTQTITRLNEAMYNDSGSYKPGSYMNVLQQIESLRLFCNLGIQFQTRHSKRETSSPVEVTPDNWSVIAPKMFHAQREISSMVCLQCDSTLEIAETLLEGDSSQMAYFASCMKFACANCTTNINRHNRTFQCGHQPSCPAALVSLSSAALDDSSGLSGCSLDNASAGLSSKIQTLISDMKSRPIDEKWYVLSHRTLCPMKTLTEYLSIVFSTWRLTLDMVQRGLDEAGITCVRFDGKVPQKDRQPIVERFKTDPSLRVMLLTLSCGAVGVHTNTPQPDPYRRKSGLSDGTSLVCFKLPISVPELKVVRFPYALQVIDVPPTCRNPTLEDQALARVHRLGQTKEVTTIRLYIRDSFEEKVMELQESKRSLAGLLLFSP
ncbi:hypothetical protein PG987_004759 [Apiospora arundinis]